MRRQTLPVILAVTLPFAAHAFESSQGDLTVTRMATNLDQPWAIGHVPGGGVLITERSGTLVHLRPDGSKIDVQGVPAVVDEGQGGLLDVMIPRDFAQSREVFLSYAARHDGMVGTALGKGRLSEDGTRLEGFQRIWQMVKPTNSGRHFGSRIVEARDGTVFLTIGDRGDRPSAQDLRNHNGSVVRLSRSGEIPADNPFIGREGIAPETYSYGHRNPQGAALDLQGNLWVAEHGAKGGDEVNRIQSGANYGWPVISYGVHYSGEKIGEGTSKAGMQQPEHYWDPSIAPSGMMVYSGKLWPDWKGNIFVGSLKFDYISRLSGSALKEVEQLQDTTTGRVRDVVEGPDGAIWFLSINKGALYKLTPN